MWRDNSRFVRTHEKNSGDAVRRLGTIIQSIFCAQSGASIRLTVWKWYPGTFPPVLENFCRASSPARLTAPGSSTIDIILSQITCKEARIWTSFWLDRKQYGWFAMFRLAKMPPSVSCCWFESAFFRCAISSEIHTRVRYVILLHEKFLQFDWLRVVVFQLNLKYLHVKIVVV